MEINHLCQELPQWNHKFEELLHLKFPLHKACRDGQHKELSRLLYDSDYDIYEEDPIYGWTPAHWAAYHGQLRCLEMLLPCGFSGDTVTSKHNQSPAHLAAYANRHLSLKLFIHYGAKCDSKDHLGETPLHKAVRSGSTECLSLLISNGADLRIKNNKGQTACNIAQECNFEHISTFLTVAENKDSESSQKEFFHNNYRTETYFCNRPFENTLNGLNVENSYDHEMEICENFQSDENSVNDMASNEVSSTKLDRKRSREEHIEDSFAKRSCFHDVSQSITSFAGMPNSNPVLQNSSASGNQLNSTISDRKTNHSTKNCGFSNFGHDFDNRLICHMRYYI